MKTAFDILIAPVLSEKAYAGFASEEVKEEKQAARYTFWVHPKATRSEVKNAVEAAFKVKVIAVNVMNLRGKTRRLGQSVGRRPDRKKAIVTLAKGQRIESLEGLI